MRLGSSRTRWQPSTADRRRAGYAALAAVVAFVTALLYLTYGRPPSEHVEVLSARSTLAAATAAPSGGLAGPAVNAAPATSAAIPSPAVSAAAALTGPPPTSALLRPGTDVIDRYDLSLDGSKEGQVAITSRYTVTNGCQPLYADVYGQVNGTWQRIFDASDPSQPYGAQLPPPTATAAGCFPKIRIFGVQPPADGGNALLLLGVAYADTSARILVFGWDAASNQPATLFDWSTGANGTVYRTATGDRIDIGEDAPLPDGAAGGLGRFTQIVALHGGTLSVAGRKLSPNCDRGHISGVGTDAATLPSRLAIDCSSGSRVVASLAPQPALTPDGIAWSHLHDGDNVQLTYDPASLEPDSAGSLPLIATLNDYSAATRMREEQRAVKPTFAPARAAPTTVRSAAPVPQQSQAAPRSSAPQSGTSGGFAPAATRSSSSAPAAAQPTAPRITVTAPAPIAPPPPAPRGLPGSAPPQAPR